MNLLFVYKLTIVEIHNGLNFITDVHHIFPASIFHPSFFCKGHVPLYKLLTMPLIKMNNIIIQ